MRDKVICVFGGTGSIGSLIVERLLQEKAKIVRVFSNDENSLWESQQKWGNKGIRYLLGDIRNLERVRRALNKVDYVFNTAAIKHVPFCEYDPIEAISVNILGLSNIIDACVEKGVKKLLQVSTDKAVEPTTLMGATKMIGERLLQVRWSQNPSIGMVCVRLGNVLESRGSLLPLIKKQVAEGKSITLTNPNMERFFMSQEEVVNFIFAAFEQGKEGEIWVPKLKEIKLIDFVQKMVGKEHSITITGNRKGEKLREKLISESEISLTRICSEFNCWIIENDYGRWEE